MSGLFGKYIIQKADGTPLDPQAKYFVLRYDGHRRPEQEALMLYASQCGNLELKEDLHKAVGGAMLSDILKTDVEVEPQ